MRVENNIVIADEGKLLKYRFGFCEQLSLDTRTTVENGQIVLYTPKVDDIKEVIPYRMDENIYYLESTNYPNLVSELIRIKYSVDDELALEANYRINGDSKEEQEFQNWRKECKKIAKQILNE